MEFPEYAAKYSDDAIACRKKIPTNYLTTLDDIINELLDNPKKFPDRIIQISRRGDNFVYTYPDPVIEVTFEIDEENKIIYFFHFSAPTLDVTNKLFICYSREDREWLDKIRKYLNYLEQQGLLKFWDDSQLKPGKPWNTQILEALESANAGVLLVSQNFLNSEFINNTELHTLLENARKRDKEIYWIHISPSTVFQSHPEITQFQSLQVNPESALEELPDAEQKKVLVEISKKLSEAVTKH